MRAYRYIVPLLSTIVTVHGAGGKHEGPEPSDFYNDKLARLYILSGGSIFAVILVWVLILRFNAHLRRLTNLNNPTQSYFVQSHRFWGWMKQHVIYSPLFRSRHNREFRLSSAMNMGTLPTRFQSALLSTVVGINIFLCCYKIPYYSEPEATWMGQLRNRSGTMAVVNLMPLVLMAGRNNPLIKMLDVSFDTFNLLHRWLGRVIVLEAVTHVVCWMVSKVHTKGWSAVQASFTGSYFIISGLVAVICFVVILLHSPSPIRHAFYETFLHFHIALVITTFYFLWVHLAKFMQRRFLIAAIVLWAVERAFRLVQLIYRNIGNGGTTAKVEALPGEAMRITLRMARPWRFKPGQHLYLYLPSIGLWTSHPFTAAWSETEEALTDEKGLVMSRQDVLGLQKPTISLVVRRRTGLTNALYEKATEDGNTTINLRAFVEGPYGTEEVLDSYGTVMLFAAGVGITHQVPYVRHLVAGHAAGTVATRRVTLVWIIQSPEHLEWIRPWMTSILAMDRRREVLRIMLFITRPRNTKEIHSPSSTVQMFPGKPDIGTLLDNEVENQIGAMGVVVCGTGSLSDDIRLACRKRQRPTHVDFIEECFTW